MAMAVPGRSSMFTFESSVHPCHVLRSLDDQRQRDVLCDVTVVAEGQSFRAHRSVLASCSEYFSQRISSLSGQSSVITLPPEVTATGFEPLLKFAYTSKLLFSKENALDIQTSVSVLGFKDLDGACFDFLLPKFFSSTKSSFVRKTCCKRKCKKGLSKDSPVIDADDVRLDGKADKPVADSPSQEEVALLCNKSDNIKMGSENIVCPATPLTPVTEAANDNVLQCPKYRKFQRACGKETAERSQQSPVIKYYCDSPCSSKSETGRCPLSLPRQVEDLFDSRIGNFRVEANKTKETYDKKQQEIEMQELQQNIETSCNVKETAKGQGQGSTRLVLPQSTREVQCERRELIGSLGQQSMNLGEKGKRANELNEMSRCMEAEEEIMERVGQEEGSAQREVHNLDYQCTLDDTNKQSTPLDWLRLQFNVSSPLPQDLDQTTSGWKCPRFPDCEVASQSGISSLNSGEDGDSDTEAEGYCDAYARERAKQVQLPYPVDQIVEMSRNDFQELLDKQNFTREQLDLVRDMRRRSKNRLAAQRCRKRKLDCIYNLQCEINKLKTEREKLIQEKSQLSHLKLKTCHSVSALCQRVCAGGNLQPEQLQVLAKYTSVECPLASYVPFIDSLRSSQHQQSAQLPPAGGGEDMPHSNTDTQYSGTKT